jgi:hypothetical protein
LIQPLFFWLAIGKSSVRLKKYPWKVLRLSKKGKSDSNDKTRFAMCFYISSKLYDRLRVRTAQVLEKNQFEISGSPKHEMLSL